MAIKLVTVTWTMQQIDLAGTTSWGYYQVRFDASGLPSGVYIYRISAGAFNRSKKMIFLK